ncbi:hypothetical protein MNBD_GAMMA21-538 [hydrothermal vent metagenome]|uniref:Uncharacterized protein n=1 Tax=hydrothermal vent metagenome TaxID=652676 RepID=A0A3B0ZYI2_9ZZZZ
MSSPVYTSTPAAQNNHYLDTLKYWSVISAYGLAAAEGIRLTQEHIDILNWLRDQFDEIGDIDIIPAMQQLAVMYGPYGGEVFLHTLFPGNVVEQSMRIAGLPVPGPEAEKLSLVN